MTESDLRRSEQGVYEPPRARGFSKDAVTSIRDRIATIESALQALESGVMDPTTRAVAPRAAHKIATTAMSAGFWDHAELAREAESAFDGTAPIDAPMLARLTTIVATIKAAFAANA